MGNNFELDQDSINFLNYIEEARKNNNSEVENNIYNEYQLLKKKFDEKRLSNKQDYEYNKCAIKKNFKLVSAFTHLDKIKEKFFKWIEIIALSPYNNKKSNEPFSVTLQNYLNDNFFKKSEARHNFQKMIAYGPPNSLRVILWMICSGQPSIRDSSKYIELLNEKIDTESEEKIRKAEDQINKDLNRTYQDDEDNITKEQIIMLENLLKVLNKKYSYCQGMNFIVGFILKVTNYNELDAFYLANYTFEKIEGYFTSGFPLLNQNLKIFTHFFHKNFPKLEENFTKMEMIPELWVSKWMQTLFTINLSFDVTCRIWDSLFAFDFDFIIPLSLSFIKVFENDLLKFTDSSDVVDFFKDSFLPQKQDITYIYHDHDNKIYSIDKIIYSAKQTYKKMKETKIMKTKNKELEFKGNENNSSKNKTNSNLSTAHSHSKIDNAFKKNNSNCYPYNTIHLPDTSSGTNSINSPLNKTSINKQNMIDNNSVISNSSNTASNNASCNYNYMKNPCSPIKEHISHNSSHNFICSFSANKVKNIIGTIDDVDCDAFDNEEEEQINENLDKYNFGSKIKNNYDGLHPKKNK